MSIDRSGRERRGKKEERYSVSFSVSLMWEEKAGLIRRLTGRCIDLSPEGIKVEVKDRVNTGITVLVSSDDFGRMGHATVRHSQRDKMMHILGLRFSTAFGLGDPARRKILARVLNPDDPHAKPTDS